MSLAQLNIDLNSWPRWDHLQTEIQLSLCELTGFEIETIIHSDPWNPIELISTLTTEAHVGYVKAGDGTCCIVIDALPPLDIRTSSNRRAIYSSATPMRTMNPEDFALTLASACALSENHGNSYIEDESTFWISRPYASTDEVRRIFTNDRNHKSFHQSCLALVKNMNQFRASPKK